MTEDGEERSQANAAADLRRQQIAVRFPQATRPLLKAWHRDAAAAELKVHFTASELAKVLCKTSLPTVYCFLALLPHVLVCTIKGRKADAADLLLY